MQINKIDLYKRIIVLYIFFYPVCDMMFSIIEQTGVLLPVSPNQVIRGMGLCMFFFIIKNLDNWIKTMLITVWSLCSLIIQMETFGSLSIVTDLAFCLKFIQNFIFLFAFIQLLKDKIIRIDELIDCLIWSSYIAAGSVLLSLFGVGNVSYEGSSRLGVKGFFSIQSTLTAYLMLIMPLYYIKFNKNFTWQMIMCVLALFSIGSKTGVFGTIIEIVFISIFDIKHNNYRSKNVRYYILLLLCISVFPLMLIEYVGYLITLYESHAYYYDIVAFLLSNRNDQIIAVESEIEMMGNEIKWNIGAVFGYGYTSLKYMLQTYNYETIERDFHGCYYCFGTVSLTILIYYLSKVFYRAIKLNIVHHFENKYIYISTLIISVGIVYGWLGGHVFYEAMNQLPFWIVSSFVWSYKYSAK